MHTIAIINLSQNPPRNDYYFHHSLRIIEKILDVKAIVWDGFWSRVEWISPMERARDINRFLRDREVDMIWAYSGGACANEVLPYIDFSNISHHKIIAGFSDTTALLVAASRSPLLEPWHMPNMRTLMKWCYGSLESLGHILERLRNPNDSYELEFARNVFDYSAEESLYPHKIVSLPGPIILRHGEASGQSIVGNLSTIDLLYGTSYEPKWDGAILCLEECSEMSLWWVRRMLMSWRSRGIFDRIHGVIWWVWQQSILQDYRSTLTNPWLTLDDVFAGYTFPVVWNVLFGHISPQMPIPFGWKIIIETRPFTICAFPRISEK